MPFKDGMYPDSLSYWLAVLGIIVCAIYSHRRRFAIETEAMTGMG